MGELTHTYFTGVQQHVMALATCLQPFTKRNLEVYLPLYTTLLNNHLG